MCEYSVLLLAAPTAIRAETLKKIQDMWSGRSREHLLKLWDITAGRVICREAELGAEVSRLEEATYGIRISNRPHIPPGRGLE